MRKGRGVGESKGLLLNSFLPWEFRLDLSS